MGTREGSSRPMAYSRQLLVLASFLAVGVAQNTSAGNTTSCPNGCFGRGKCQGGVCLCGAESGAPEPGYAGDDCSLPLCDQQSGRPCSGHGTCDGLSGCKCDKGFYGAFCASTECSCLNGPAACSAAEAGGDLKCACSSDFTGNACQFKTCPSNSNGTQCNGNGECNPKTGQCKCFPSHAGTICSRMLCPNNCTNNGVCQHETGTCVCFHSFSA